MQSVQCTRHLESPSESDLLLLHDAYVRQLAQLSKRNALQKRNKLLLTTTTTQQQTAGIAKNQSQQKPQQTEEQRLAAERRRRKDLAYARLMQCGPEPPEEDHTSSANFDCRSAAACCSQCNLLQPLGSLCPDLYVCARSGRMHHCTSVSCSFISYTIDCRVCTLTGRSYNHDEYIVLPTHTELADPRNRESILTAAQQEQDAEHVQRLLEEFVAETLQAAAVVKQAVTAQPDSANAAVAVCVKAEPGTDSMKVEGESESDKKRRLAASRRKAKKVLQANRRAIGRPGEAPQPTPVVVVAPPVSRSAAAAAAKRHQTWVRKAHDSSALLCEGMNFIKQLMPELDLSECTRLSKVCLHMWLRIIQTQRFQELKGKYKYRTHVAACLYNAIEGLQVQGVVLLEPEPSLVDKLPESKHLKRYNMRPGAYTSACGYLHELATLIV